MSMPGDPESYANDQGRLPEIIEGSRRTQLLVESIEEYAKQLRHLRTALPRTGIRQTIEPGLGALMVNANGDLLTLQLDMDNVKLSDISTLGGRITTALKTAEQRAETFRNKKFEQLRKSNNSI